MIKGRRSSKMQYEEVLASAEAMLAEGKPPSVRALRDRIGGSPNDIAPLLAKWRAEGGQQRSLKLRSSTKPRGSVWDLGDAAYLDAIEAYFIDAGSLGVAARLERAESCLRQVLAAHRLSHVAGAAASSSSAPQKDSRVQ
ncbi:DNA-binding protein [Caenimonas sedimenti]|nr:DNA-binding protein [Caenimonas sedimenti]